MKISVIIPTYNCASYLPACIESFLKQTRKPDEIIVFDDGSTDNTRELELGNPDTVKFLYHNKNKGLNAARQTGLDHATGDLIFSCDADAVYAPTCLEEMEKPLIDWPKVSFVYSDYTLSEDGKERSFQSKPFDVQQLQKQNYINASSLVRREHLPKYDTKIKRLTDWDLWLTMAEKGHTGIHIPKSLFTLYLRDEGISSKGHYDYVKSKLQVQIKHGIQPKVAVLTITRDRLDYTKRTYEGMKKLGCPFDWYVLDNGSTDGTQEWLKKQKCKYLWLEKENIGIANAVNKFREHIKDAGYDYVVKIDNDCEIVSPDILKELVILSQYMGDKMVLSPRVEGLNNPMPRFKYLKVGDHVLSPVPHVGGIFCFRPYALDKDFRNDPDYASQGDDMEFSMFAGRSGYGVGYIEDLEVWHMDTTNGQYQKYEEYYQRQKEERAKQPKTL
jgi:glycosyltransferase involved in cell wall biosynthesis